MSEITVSDTFEIIGNQAIVVWGQKNHRVLELRKSRYFQEVDKIESLRERQKRLCEWVADSGAHILRSSIGMPSGPGGCLIFLVPTVGGKRRIMEEKEAGDVG